MRNFIATGWLFLFSLLILPLPAFPEDTAQVPGLSLEEREFDFGTVKEGSRITHAFTVQNKGTGTLEIMNVSPG